MILKRHEFGADYLLDCVVRLTEMVKRQQFLIREMLDARPPYVFGGDQTLAAWLESLEAHVVADALAHCDGGQEAAVQLLGESHRRHFGVDGQKRIRYAQRSFAEVAAGRKRSGNWWKGGPRRKGVITT